MENTIDLTQDLQEPKQVTPEKEQATKAPGWYPKPREEKVLWGQARETPGWNFKKRMHEAEEEPSKKHKRFVAGKTSQPSTCSLSAQPILCVVTNVGPPLPAVR